MRLSNYLAQRFLMLTATAAALVGPGAAQDVSGNPPNASPATGVYSTGSYAPGNIESVNTVNGNVTLSFPVGQLPPWPGGFSAGATLIYNSAIYDSPATPIDTSDASMPYVPSSHGGGWSYGYKYTLWAQPRVPVDKMTQGVCNLLNSTEQKYWYKNFIQTPDGSNHILYLVSANPSGSEPAIDSSTGFLSTDFAGLGNPSCMAQEQYTGTLVFATVDGTGIRVESDAAPGNPSTWKAFLPDGTRINGSVEAAQSPNALSPGLGPGGSDGAAWYADDSPADLVTDRNGNTLSIAGLCQINTPCTDYLEDHENRTMTVTYVSSGSASPNNSWVDTITAPGPNGILVTTVNSTMGNARGVSYECQSNLSGYNNSTLCPLNTYLPQVTSIQMPATEDGNQTTFAFQYAPASGNYGWGEVHTVQKCVGAGLTSCSQPLWSVGYAYTFDTTSTARPPGVTINPISKKTLTYAENLDGVGSTGLTESTYYTIYYPGGGAYQIYGGTANSYLNTITNPDGSSTYLSIVSLCASGTVARDTCSPVVYHTSNPDGSASDIAWAWNTTLPSGVPTSTIVNPYPQYQLDTRAGFSRGSQTPEDVNGNVTELKQYNWTPVGSGLVTFSGNRLVSIGCANGTSTPVCPMLDTVTPYAYVSGGTSYLTPSYATASQRFLRALESVSINGAPPTGYGYDSYTTTGNVNQIDRWDSGHTKWIYQYMSYLGNGNITSATDLNGNLTVTCYDSTWSLYPISQVSAAVPGSTCPASERPEGQTTNFSYDFNSGVLISATDADNHVTTSYTYDNLGRQKTAVEAGPGLSRTTSTVYDDVNLTTTVTQTDSPQDLVTTTYYDPLGRVRLTADGDGNKVATAYRYGNTPSHPHYQLQSNPYSSTDAVAGWTLTTLDPVGRTTEVDHYPAGALPSPWTNSSPTADGTATVVYDQNGSSCTGPITSTTDEAGNTHSSCTDGLGRQVSVTEPNASSGGAGTVTSYGYDALGNLSTVDVSNQANNNCTLTGSSTTHMRCFAYSTLSRLVSATNPESGTTSYVYDNNGNMTQRTDADGNVTHMNSYDGMNRPGSISYSVTGTTVATPTVTYTYDQDFKGTLSSVSNSASATSYTHDSFGRVHTNTQTTGSNPPYTFTYGYSQTDALASMQYPSGRVVNYGLDAADRVTTVQNTTAGGNYAIVGYRASGAISSLLLGNGATQAFTWNDRVQPTGLTVTGSPAAGSPSLLTLGFYPCASQAITCTSGNNGNLQSQKITIPGMSSSLTQSYSYDHLNRLTQAQETGGSGWTQGYGYDTLGNRWVSTNTSLPTLSSETPQSSSWYSSTAPNRIAGWSYDSNGNLLGPAGVAKSYTYDAENRQVTANINGAVSNYSYDGNGQRVSRVVGSQTTIYVYDAEGNLAAEYPNWADGSSCDTSTCYAIEDHLGSTRLLTDSSTSRNVQSVSSRLPGGWTRWKAGPQARLPAPPCQHRA